MSTPAPLQAIKIVPYQPGWADEFRQTGVKLRGVLGDLALRIDHIGSTSVTGLGAKDIVDIQVTVASLFPSEPFTHAITAAGYQSREGIFDDHRPAGNEQPDAQWQKRYFREPAGEKRTHIHVRVEGAANQRYALLFRDFLRANSEAAGSYDRVKRELARLHPHDIDAYLAVKDPVCDLIIIAAEAWAASTSWQPGPSDA